MTDNEIIKALECCIDYECRCVECPYFGIASDDVSCGKEHGIDMLDLINRQKAEIERLQNDYLSMQSTLAKMSTGVEQAKVEAIKEFAERLKEKKCSYSETEYTFDFDGVTVENIDAIVKEMTEEHYETQ